MRRDRRLGKDYALTVAGRRSVESNYCQHACCGGGREKVRKFTMYDILNAADCGSRKFDSVGLAWRGL